MDFDKQVKVTYGDEEAMTFESSFENSEVKIEDRKGFL